MTTRIKRSTWCVVALVVLLAAGWQWRSACLRSEHATKLLFPRAVLGETRLDHGAIAPGDVVHGEFRIRNVGGRRLIVSEDVGYCCGAAETSGKEHLIVPPGDWRIVRIDLPTDQRGGPQSRTVRYRTNDPMLPRFELTVSATIQAEDDRISVESASL